MSILARIKDFSLSALGIIISLAFTYVMFYWGFYRGGGYLIHQFAAPGEEHHGLIDVLKVIWSLCGAAAGAMVAAYVRRWFVYRTLRDKLLLLEAARLELLSYLESYGHQLEINVAVSGGMLKYLFGEKEYAQLARYLAAEESMTILRTISAIDLVATLARTATAKDDIARVKPGLLDQLRRFDVQNSLKQLKLLRDDSDRVVSDVAEEAYGTPLKEGKD